MKPSVQAVSTRLCCEIIIDSVFTLPDPLPIASYRMLFCSSSFTTACFTAIVPRHVMSFAVAVIQNQQCPPLSEKGTPHSMGSPTNITVGLRYCGR